MNSTFFTLIIILGGLGILVSMAWRLYSKRQSLPCPAWLGWMVEMENPFTRVSSSQFIVEHLDLEPGLRVLDAGCGPGRVTLPLAEAVGPEGEVVALDLQQEMLDRVRSEANRRGLENIHFLQAALGTGEVKEKDFDRVVMVSVLGEIPQPAEALQEIAAGLKPGGILSITEVIFDPHFQTRKAVLSWTTAAGLQEKEFLGKRLAYTLLLEKPI
jgi:ubiquinone/menaquinone biosynthesis C-methylase UbiE